MLLNNDRSLCSKGNGIEKKRVASERDVVQKALVSYNRLVTGAAEKNQQQSRWMHFNAYGRRIINYR